MDPVPVLFPLLYIIQIAGIAAKPSSHRWMFFPPIAVIATFLLFRFNVEAVTVLLLSASDFLLLTDVQRELRLIGQPKSISDAPLSDRLIWAVKLVTELRGIGWAHEPTAALPPRPITLTRGQFIVSRVKWLVLYALLFDVGQMLARHNPSFQETAPPFAEQGLLWRCYTMFIFFITSTPLLIIGLNLIPSLIFVTAGFSQPSEWPHLFGSLFEAYTIHNFWRSAKNFRVSFCPLQLINTIDSRTWHQLLRRVNFISFVPVPQLLTYYSEIRIPRKIPCSQSFPFHTRHQSLCLCPSLCRLFPLWIGTHPCALGWPRSPFLPPPSCWHHV